MMKRFVKDAVVLTATGIGLSAMAGVDDSGVASKMSKSVPVVANLVAAKMVVDSAKELLTKKKRF